MTREEYVTYIKEAALTIAKRGVMDKLLKLWPKKLMGMTLFNGLTGWVVGLVLDIAIKETELGAFFLFIDLRTSLQGRAFEGAALRNATVRASATATPEEKLQAESDVISTFRSLAKLTS
jgi:hypothetical protein